MRSQTLLVASVVYLFADVGTVSAQQQPSVASRAEALRSGSIHVVPAQRYTRADLMAKLATLPNHPLQKINAVPPPPGGSGTAAGSDIGVPVALSLSGNALSAETNGFHASLTFGGVDVHGVGPSSTPAVYMDSRASAAMVVIYEKPGSAGGWYTVLFDIQAGPPTGNLSISENGNGNIIATCPTRTGATVDSCGAMFQMPPGLKEGYILTLTSDTHGFFVDAAIMRVQ